MEIFQFKEKGKEDSFFFEGDIARAKKEDKEFLLIATGDIDITIDGKRFRNDRIQGAIEHFKLTDKKLRDLEAKGRLIWGNNNWFEVLYKDKTADTWDCDLGMVAWSYDEAIELLRSYLKGLEGSFL